MNYFNTYQLEIMRTPIPAQLLCGLRQSEKPVRTLNWKIQRVFPEIVGVMIVVLIQMTVMYPAAAADNYKTIRKNLNNCEKEFWSNVEKEKVRFLDQIEKARRNAIAEGKIELDDKLKAEHRAFSINNTLPSTTSSSIDFRKRVTLLLEQMLGKYEKEIVNESKQNKKNARRLGNERDRFESKFEIEFPKTRYCRTRWTQLSDSSEKFEKNINTQEWIQHTHGIRYTLQELGRNSDCINLYDQQRTVKIYLYDNRCEIVDRTRIPKLFSGKFDD